MATNAFRIGLVLVLALAAAVAANVVLLGVATGPRDPVGRLSPRAGLVRLPPTTPATTTTSPSSGGTTARPHDDGTAASHPDD